MDERTTGMGDGDNGEQPCKTSKTDALDLPTTCQTTCVRFLIILFQTNQQLFGGRFGTGMVAFYYLPLLLLLDVLLWGQTFPCCCIAILNYYCCFTNSHHGWDRPWC